MMITTPRFVLFVSTALALCAIRPLVPSATAEDTPTINADEAVPQFGTPFTQVPDAKNVVMYQVNFRAFSPKGDFAGVQARLDAIKDLGVNTLYLMPIYPVGELKSVNSPYCVKDYLAVSSEFGTLDDLRTLVAEAHKRNMAVLFDWVADHTSLDNAWISNKAWYKQDKDGNIISPPKTGWLDVAALNYDNTDMRKAMIDAMRYWVFQANIDGYRCDAADFIPADFWKEAIDNLRTIKTHKLLLFAEGTRKDHFTSGFQLEYAMGFYYNMVNRIFKKNESVRSIDSVNITEYKTATPDDEVVRYTSNHDVDQTDGSPLELLGGKQGSMAAFVVTAYMKGVPMIYDGQEVGCPDKLSFFNNSTPIDWTLNPEMTAEYKKIIGLRNDSEAIKQGELLSFSSKDVCVFTKTFHGEKVLVIVNLRDAAMPCELPGSVLDGNKWKNAFDGTDASVKSHLDLQPFEYQVYKKR